MIEIRASDEYKRGSLINRLRDHYGFRLNRFPVILAHGNFFCTQSAQQSTSSIGKYYESRKSCMKFDGGAFSR